jgi:hypothetical protein
MHADPAVRVVTAGRIYKVSEVTMFTKPLILAILAACGVPSNPATTEPPPDQPDVRPPDETQKDQHFCCQSVDHTTMSGDGCQTIGATQIDLCTNVLYCEGNWAKEGGKVWCE